MTLTRRQILEAGGLAAGSLLFARPAWGAKLRVTHVFSLIGEFSTDGAYLSSMVNGPDATMLDLAVSIDPDMSQPLFAGERPVGPGDRLVHHDLAGLLAPSSQYYARLVCQGRMFGRTLSFRTQVPDGTAMHLKIALVSCQQSSSTADRSQLGWAAIQRYNPDLLLHMGDFGYWGGTLHVGDPYQRHIQHYASQLQGLPTMRTVLEAVSSLIEVSDHETSANNGDTYDDPITAVALQAYFRLMPWRSFGDPTGRSRFLTRKVGANVRLIAPDFRSLDRSPGAWPDNATKTAWGEAQFALFVAAMQQPEALKIILSDPGASPADRPATPNDPNLRDKWCNYQTAFQAMSDVVRNTLTVDGRPIQADVWSGDRHLLGTLAEADNPWGPFDVLTSSGIDAYSLTLERGELYDEMFGAHDEPRTVVKQHMEIDLYDDTAGTITRVASGINDFTGEEVVFSEKSWSYV